MAGREVVVVTGASRGIGLAFVKQLLERGKTVVAGARKPQGSQGLQELAKTYPKQLTLVVLDISSEASIEVSS